MATGPSTLHLGVALVLLHCTAEPAVGVEKMADCTPEPVTYRDVSSAADDCFLPELVSLSDPSDCGPRVHACEADQETCVPTPRTERLGWLLTDTCQLYCGQLFLTLRQGGISSLDGRLGDIECVRAALLGNRWDCAPSDRMTSVYLGSCTVR